MIGKDIKQHELDFEKTILYFIDHIQCGKTLSEKIVNKIDFHKGKFFTILPVNANLDRLFEFAYGGIIPPIPYGDLTYKTNGGSESFHPQQIITMDHECSKFMTEYVNQRDKNYAVVENYMLSPDSSHVHIDSVKMIPYETDVYYFLDKKNSSEEIYKIIRKCGLCWHSLSVLTHLNEDIPMPLKNETLDRICDNAKFVIAGAYDGEGYVFWERF